MFIKAWADIYIYIYIYRHWPTVHTYSYICNTYAWLFINTYSASEHCIYIYKYIYIWIYLYNHSVYGNYRIFMFILCEHLTQAKTIFPCTGSTTKCQETMRIDQIYLSHRGLGAYVSASKLHYHCFGWRLSTCSVPSHCPEEKQIYGVIYTIHYQTPDIHYTSGGAVNYFIPDIERTIKELCKSS